MNKYIFAIIISLISISCSNTIKIEKEYTEKPEIFPDYVDVTIPPNIAPLNFRIEGKANQQQAAIIKVGDKEFQTNAQKGQIQISESKWKDLLQSAIGNKISVTACVEEDGVWAKYPPFTVTVTKDSIDPYIAYRLIEPGYAVWREMGIYQRNIESFEQTAIIENKMVETDCMNCHSFRMQDPDQMMLHIRGGNGGTMVIVDGKIEKLDTKTDQTISALVYPSWHPSGKYIAFSVNDTKQDYHTSNKNRIEVYDNASDVVVYDVEKQEIVTTAALFSPTRFETFPTFSPDGKTLYFGSSDVHKMPDDYKNVKYSLCAISFNPETREFGTTVDTVFNAVVEKKSATFPRVSPNGKSLLYAKAEYGGFHIWHKDSDLYIYDIEKKVHYPLTLANSDNVESYHSWSSNSHWIVYSSRRIDGLYTRPFIAYINDEGKAEKAFALPQKDVNLYTYLNKSYNVPEFIKDKVSVSAYSIAQKAKAEKGTHVKFNDK